MKRVLFVLGQLSDLDIEWMINNGFKRDVGYGERLIIQGSKIDNLYIILSGEFSIQDEAHQNYDIARIGAGEIVGEMSFIDARPPSASVLAEKNSTVFAISCNDIKQKLNDDKEFAARFTTLLPCFYLTDSEKLRAD